MEEADPLCRASSRGVCRGVGGERKGPPAAPGETSGGGGSGAAEGTQKTLEALQQRKDQAGEVGEQSDKPLGEAVLKRIKRAYEPNHLSPPSPPLSPHLFHLSGHPWLSHEKQSDKPLGEAVLKRIKNFSAANKMKKLALKVIACNLSREEILGLKKLFKGMDKDGSGSITFAELKTGMQKLGNPMSEEQLQQIMEAADMDHSGTIDYTEFITATMQMNKVEKEEHIWKAFQHFDRDGSGGTRREALGQAMQMNKVEKEEHIWKAFQNLDYDGSGFITVSELRDALANEDMLEVGELEQIIEEVDTDKVRWWSDGRV
ncbi:unnamed protein product [Closterium sp. NIES-54]